MSFYKWLMINIIVFCRVTVYFSVIVVVMMVDNSL